MNNVTLTGRLVRDPELREAGEKKIPLCSFTLAIDRKQKKGAYGKKVTDWIDCEAWNNKADFTAKYFKKGMKAEVVGSLVTSSYTNKDGNTVKRMVVNVEDIDFAESRASSERYEKEHADDQKPEKVPETAPVHEEPKVEPKEELKAEPVTTKADDLQTLLDEAGDDVLSIPEDISFDEMPFI